MAGQKVQTRAEEAERDVSESNLTISEFDTENEPFFTGWFRVNGILYYFNNEQATGWSGIADDSVVYARAVPSGDSCTIEYTTTAPTYNTIKGGWYEDATGSASKRYITDAGRVGYLKMGKYDLNTYVYKHIKGSDRFNRFIKVCEDSTTDILATEDDIYKVQLSYGEDVYILDKFCQIRCESISSPVLTRIHEGIYKEPTRYIGMTRYDTAWGQANAAADIYEYYLNFSKGSATVSYELYLFGVATSVDNSGLYLRVER